MGSINILWIFKNKQFYWEMWKGINFYRENYFIIALLYLYWLNDDWLQITAMKIQASNTGHSRYNSGLLNLMQSSLQPKSSSAGLSYKQWAAEYR